MPPTEFLRAGDSAPVSAPRASFSFKTPAFGLGLPRFWKVELFRVPRVVLGELVPLLGVVPPIEYRFSGLPGDSGVSGVLVLGLLEDRNFALADSVAAI